MAFPEVMRPSAACLLLGLSGYMTPWWLRTAAFLANAACRADVPVFPTRDGGTVLVRLLITRSSPTGAATDLNDGRANFWLVVRMEAIVSLVKARIIVYQGCAQVAGPTRIERIACGSVATTVRLTPAAAPSNVILGGERCLMRPLHCQVRERTAVFLIGPVRPPRQSRRPGLTPATGYGFAGRTPI